MRSSPIPPLLIMAIVAALLAACSDEPSGASGDGDPDVLRVSSDAVHVLASSEDLTMVRDLEIDSDGTVWVLNDSPPYFIAFDADEGRQVALMGSQGGGPQEFRHRPVWLGFGIPTFRPRGSGPSTAPGTPWCV